MENKPAIWVAFGDIHEQISQLEYMGSDLAEARGVIITGDLTGHGGVQGAQTVLEAVRRRNSRIWAQIGNMDPPSVDRYLTNEGVNLHGRARVLDPDFPDIFIIGVGASTPTPFGTPSEVPDSQIAAWLEKAHSEAPEAARLILVAHDPPFGTAADRLGSGRHVGSKAVREFIERVQPEICLTGHIHESAAVDNLGRTTIINPGPLFHGGYVRLHLSSGSLEAELIA